MSTPLPSASASTYQIYSSSRPNFIIKTVPTIAIFRVNKQKMGAASGVFQDMFGVCEDIPPDGLGISDVNEDQSMEIHERPDLFTLFLALVHADVVSEEEQNLVLASDSSIEGDSDFDQALIPPSRRLVFDAPVFEDDTSVMPLPPLPKIIPFPLLRPLYDLADKYDLIPPLVELLHEHIKNAAGSDNALEVYSFAHQEGLISLAAHASSFLLSRPAESYTLDEVERWFPTAASYHRLVMLQAHQVKELRRVLSGEELFPHGYGYCAQHGKAATASWQAQKEKILHLVSPGMDIVVAMSTVKYTVPKTCSACPMAMERALAMLGYKTMKIARTFDRVPGTMRQVNGRFVLGVNKPRRVCLDHEFGLKIDASVQDSTTIIFVLRSIISSHVMRYPAVSVVDEATAMLISSMEHENRSAAATKGPKAKAARVLEYDDSSSQETIIEALDNRVLALKLAMRLLQERIWEQIADTRQKRNRYSSIHRLPNETLVSVFQFTLQQQGASLRYQKMAAMSRVCRKWRTVTLDTPSLWTSLSTKSPQKSLEAAIQRSRSAELTVEFESELDRGFNTLLAHAPQLMERIQSLSINMPSSAKRYPFLRVPAPILQTLRLYTGFHRQGVAPPVELFGDQAPQLREVSIQGFSVSPACNILGGLTSLVLSSVMASDGLSHLCSVVRQNPNLQKLVMENVTLANTEDTAEGVSAIDLPRLAALSLRGFVPEITARLLSLLDAPQCTQMMVNCLIVEAMNDTGVKALSVIKALTPKWDRPLMKTVAGRGSLALVIDGTTITVYEPISQQERIILSVPVFPGEALGAWLHRLLGPDNFGSGGLIVRFGQTVMNWGASFKAVEGLKVVGMHIPISTDANPLIELLKQRMSNDPRRFTFPSLERLTVDGTFDSEAMLSMMKFRYSTLKASARGADAIIPASLKHLSFGRSPSMDIDTYYLISNIVGKDAISWNGPPETARRQTLRWRDEGSDDEDEDDEAMFDDGTLDHPVW